VVLGHTFTNFAPGLQLQCTLSQTMGLGVIAQRVNAKLIFDPVRRQITNHKVANELLKGVPPRKGWEQYYRM
jgi:hypothetical protein